MNLTRTWKLSVSAICIALYCVIMYLTQSISFLPTQMRLATALYGLGYFFPFLMLPLGIANFLSNIIGGYGPVDMIGGCIVGILATGTCAWIGMHGWKHWFCLIPIVLIPGFGVALWLAPMTGIPYIVTVGGLLLGQIIPAILGVLLIKSLEGIWKKQGLKRIGNEGYICREEIMKN